MQSFDVVVIGAGPAGYVAAIRAAQLGLKTACIEKENTVGGTCLNWGCIPSKYLLNASEHYHQMAHGAANFGLTVEGLKFDLEAIQKKKTSVVGDLTNGIRGLFRKNKVTHIVGEATFTSPTELKVGAEIIQGKNFIIATGSEATPLPFLPFDEKRILSSTGALNISKLPKKMLVVGAGVIGLELGSVYARFGSEVTFVEFTEGICPGVDPDICKPLVTLMKKQGVQFHFQSKVTAGKATDTGVELTVAAVDSKSFTLNADIALIAIGRRAFTQGLGLEALGITPERGQISVDGYFRTKHPHIYAVGDVINGPMLAHKASEEGYAVAEIIAGHSPHVHYTSIPGVVYTWPELANVGLSEVQAKAAGLNILVGTFPFLANGRARTAADTDGLVKVIAHKETERLLGIHICGPNASEMIAHGVTLLNKKASLDDLATACFPHPTCSEAIKEAALAAKRGAIHF